VGTPRWGKWRRGRRRRRAEPPPKAEQFGLRRAGMATGWVLVSHAARILDCGRRLRTHEPKFGRL